MNPDSHDTPPLVPLPSPEDTSGELELLAAPLLEEHTPPDGQALPQEQCTLLGRAEQANQSYQVWAEAHPYVATATETVALYAVRKVIRMGAARAGMRMGNGHSSSQVEKAAAHPLAMGALTVVGSPVLEEVAFRGVGPDLVMKHSGVNEQSRAAKTIRHAFAIGFAAAHTGNPATKKGRENLNLPIMPLIGGLNYERLRRERGLQHAILGHAINNALAVIEVWPAIRRLRGASAK